MSQAIAKSLEAIERPSQAREKSFVQRCVAVWNAFFHSPVDLGHVAILRICFGLVATVYFSAWLPYVEEWFGENGIYPYAISRECSSAYCWTILGWLKEDVWLRTALVVAVVQSVLLTLGLLSRVQAFGVFFWAMMFQHRNNLIMDAEDVVFRLIAFYMLWLPLGEIFSLDAVWRGWRQSTVKGTEAIAARQFSAWPVRMMQIQMVVLMATAAGWKLTGADWRSGDALYFVSRLDDLFGRFPMPDFLFEVPIVCRSIVWFTIAVELLAPIFIWFPSTRRASLILLLLFHIATDYMMHLFLFHWIMMIGWMFFLMPGDYAWLFPGRKKVAVGA